MKQSPFIYDTNIIQNFTNGLFGSVRSILINGEPWFVGVDVASCLGYEKTRNAIEAHIDQEDKTIININTALNQGGIPGNPNMVIINESGLYSLIFSSKLPAAKAFKHWVTHEVLPTMRQIGFSNSMNILQEENMRLQRDNNKLYKENKQLQEENDNLYNCHSSLRDAYEFLAALYHHNVML